MTKKDARRLEEVRDMLTTEHIKTCSFRFADPAYSAQVAEDTRIWRETWILPLLDELVEKYGGRSVNPVNHDCRTGDVIKVGGVVYDVVDTFPTCVTLENGCGERFYWGYARLSSFGATFVRKATVRKL